jgi:ribosomal protein S18 acetylase RimI-like enzyme
MMQDSLQIRPAHPDDGEVASVLMYSAYTQAHITYPLQEKQTSGFIKRLQDYFRQDSNRFSYQNTQVAEQNGVVVGLVLSFPGREEGLLNAAVGSWLEREAKGDEWYVDALAVLKNWEHRGIGTRLLQAAEQQARQHLYGKIALHVAQGNKPALDLYAHLHYVVTGQTFLYQRPYIHMIYTLES